jgi:hypothetical protein
MRRAVVLAIPPLLALLATACGKSKESELLDQRRAICDKLVANGETVRQASDDFGLPPNPLTGTVECRTDYALPSGSQCPAGALLCRRVWEWVANDQGLCSAFGCVYLCTGFSPGPPAALVDDSVICATRFDTGQPLFF